MKILKFLLIISFFSCNITHDYLSLEDRWIGTQVCKSHIKKYDTTAEIKIIPYSDDIGLTIKNEYINGKFYMEEISSNRFRFSNYPINIEMIVVSDDSIHIDFEKKEFFWTTTFCDIDLIRN